MQPLLCKRARKIESDFKIDGVIIYDEDIQANVLVQNGHKTILMNVTDELVKTITQTEVQRESPDRDPDLSYDSEDRVFSKGREDSISGQNTLGSIPKTVEFDAFKDSLSVMLALAGTVTKTSVRGERPDTDPEAF